MILTQTQLKCYSPAKGDVCSLRTTNKDPEMGSPRIITVYCNDCNGEHILDDYDSEFECEECGCTWKPVDEDWFELVSERTDV